MNKLIHKCNIYFVYIIYIIVIQYLRIFKIECYIYIKILINVMLFI